MEKMKHNYSTVEGQILIIWITGRTELFIAQVIKDDREIWLKVEEEGPYAKLKPSDYIIKEYYTSLLQSGDEAATKLLREAVEL